FVIREFFASLSEQVEYRGCMKRKEKERETRNHKTTPPLYIHTLSQCWLIPSHNRNRKNIIETRFTKTQPHYIILLPCTQTTHIANPSSCRYTDPSERT
ncbi:uncharacterized protein H6S33_006243, partial [Morchella sextelata]|uniref:uncharacterized protein n=1 Tax=Morchella sextelata TaxID=1174677 RepID=UPI001D03D59C